MTRKELYKLDDFEGPLLVGSDDGPPNLDFDLRAAAKYVKENGLLEVTDEIKAMFPVESK